MTVTLRDAWGNPVDGATVALTANTGTSATVEPPTGTSGPDGAATFAVSDAASETDTLSAAVTSDGDLSLAQQPVVDFTRLAAGHAALSPPTAGTGTTVTAAFTTSAAGALGAGSTVTLLAPPGTALPAGAGDYAITASSGSATVSGVVTAAVEEAPPPTRPPSRSGTPPSATPIRPW